MFRFILPILLLASLSGPASAQIYKYIDKDGGVHYTDDLNQVPEAQQETAQRYAEPESKSSPKAPTGPKVTPVPATPPVKKVATPPKRLSDQEKALEIEYQELMAEKKRIENEIATYSKRYKTRKRKGVSRKKLKELEFQKAEWEKKFQDYQDRKKALEISDKKEAKK